MKKAVLYEIVNKITLQRYVGVTIQKLSVRWGRHLYLLRRGLATEKIQKAFDEYGEKSFYISEIKSGLRQDMLLMEKELTKETIISGYNTIIGGGDIEERRNSALVFHEKLRVNPEYAKLFYKKLSEGHLGKKISEESKMKMSKAKLGKRWKDEHRLNRSKLYSGSGNPNAGNYRVYLNINTGVYYTTPELYSYLGVNKGGLRTLYMRNDSKVRSFIKA